MKEYKVIKTEWTVGLEDIFASMHCDETNTFNCDYKVTDTNYDTLEEAIKHAKEEKILLKSDTNNSCSKFTCPPTPVHWEGCKVLYQWMFRVIEREEDGRGKIKIVTFLVAKKRKNLPNILNKKKNIGLSSESK